MTFRNHMRLGMWLLFWKWGTAMSLRQKLQNPAVGGGIAGAVIVVAVVMAVMNSGGDGGPRMVGQRFYDLNTGELFQGPREGDMPTDAPSGPLKGDDPPDIGGKAGVKAWVYSCGKCTEGEMFIGYLAYIPEEYWKFNESEDMEEFNKMREQLRIKAPDAKEWILNRSEEGKALQVNVLKKCKNIKTCNEVNDR